MPDSPAVQRLQSRLISNARKFVQKAIGRLAGSASIKVPRMPDCARGWNPEVVHFVHQNIFETESKFIFTPHDFQHEYHPEYFDQRTLAVRRYLYRKNCQDASRVACISKACLRDVVKFTGVDVAKCSVVYNAAPTLGYAAPSRCTIEEFKSKHQLPESFLYFPAKAYPHKNHLRLLEALSLMKNVGEPISIVCSGPLTEYYRSILLPRIEELQLHNDIRFLGWVKSDDVNALYALSAGLIFPSLFEGFGIPLVEAMAAGKPVACSNTSCLPEIVGKDAILFDPENASAIATAIKQLLRGGEYVEGLSVSGKQHSEKFDWKRSAVGYLCMYRDIIHEK
jgi:glycosyltransferase involved in cell wall biosynthesis